MEHPAQHKFKNGDDNCPELKFKKMTKDAITPKKSSIFAAGFDLFSAKELTIPARGCGVVDTDISIMLPEGTYGRIAPRSGLALHQFIGIGGGVIDFDYTGNVGVILFNHSFEQFRVNKGDRIAQLIVEKISYPTLIEVDEIDKIGKGSRGANRFGSSGK